MQCTCNSKSKFLHLSHCDSVPKPKIPLTFLKQESDHNPGSIIFYVSVTPEDSIKQLVSFRSTLIDGDWLYEVQAGTVGTITMNNMTEITFLPEQEAYILLELPNSHAIYYEATNNSTSLAEELIIKTTNLKLVDPVSKELM